MAHKQSGWHEHLDLSSIFVLLIPSLLNQYWPSKHPLPQMQFNYLKQLLELCAHYSGCRSCCNMLLSAPWPTQPHCSQCLSCPRVAAPGCPASRPLLAVERPLLPRWPGLTERPGDAPGQLHPEAAARGAKRHHGRSCYRGNNRLDCPKDCVSWDIRVSWQG